MNALRILWRSNPSQQHIQKLEELKHTRQELCLDIGKTSTEFKEILGHWDTFQASLADAGIPIQGFNYLNGVLMTFFAEERTPTFVGEPLDRLAKFTQGVQSELLRVKGELLKFSRSRRTNNGGRRWKATGRAREDAARRQREQTKFEEAWIMKACQRRGRELQPTWESTRYRHETMARSWREGGAERASLCIDNPHRTLRIDNFHNVFGLFIGGAAVRMYQRMMEADGRFPPEGRQAAPQELPQLRRQPEARAARPFAFDFSDASDSDQSISDVSDSDWEYVENQADWGTREGVLHGVQVGAGSTSRYAAYFMLGLIILGPLAHLYCSLYA